MTCLPSKSLGVRYGAPSENSTPMSLLRMKPATERTGNPSSRLIAIDARLACPMSNFPAPTVCTVTTEPLPSWRSTSSPRSVNQPRSMARCSGACAACGIQSSRTLTFCGSAAGRWAAGVAAPLATLAALAGTLAAGDAAGPQPERTTSPRSVPTPTARARPTLVACKSGMPNMPPSRGPRQPGNGPHGSPRRRSLGERPIGVEHVVIGLRAVPGRVANGALEILGGGVLDQRLRDGFAVVLVGGHVDVEE